jgi:hypothetical protein
MYPMKIQFKILIIWALTSIFLGACQTDTDPPLHNYPENARLIRVLHYLGLDAREQASQEEYEYDGEGKLIKTSVPLYQNGKRAGIDNYKVYEYDSQKRLSKIASYNYNINGGFINLKNIIFSYHSDGVKEKETIEYAITQSAEEVIFHHDGKGRLILKENLNSTQMLDSYHLFKYDGEDQLVEESIHDAHDRLMRKHIHHYLNGNNTEIKVYVGDTDELLRKITKTYDKNKNLILLQSEELMMNSSATSYTHKFEYE